MTRLASHISETAVTTGTGNLTLAGSAVNRRSFNAEYGLNKRFPYQIEHEGTDWEEGVGYLSGTTTFIRETVMRSSNADALVNFGAGEKNISVDFISMMQFGYVTKVLSVTDSDVTAQVGTHYELDVSGLTASRNFALPIAKTGDQIRVKLTTGDADHELIIKGAATVTINGGTAATEWSRLFIDDEVVEFRATSATNWDVVHDGKIPSYARITATVVDLPDLLTGVWTVITGLNVLDYDNASLADTVNSRIYFRRNGRYDISGSYYGSSMTGSSRGIVYLEGGINASAAPWVYHGGSALANLWSKTYEIDVSLASYAYLSVRQDSGLTKSLTSTTGNNIAIKEIF